MTDSLPHSEQMRQGVFSHSHSSAHTLDESLHDIECFHIGVLKPISIPLAWHPD